MSKNDDLRARLSDVNASIAKQKSRLQSLEKVRRSIQRRLDKIAYPVFSLPPEITSEIFLRCLPPLPFVIDPSKNGPSLSLAPLLLLQICSAWRSIAISTPRLWFHLHLNLDAIDVHLEVAMAKFVGDWFSRAGSCPLSFSVRGYMGMGGYGSDGIRAVLLRYAPQLQSITLQLETPGQHFNLLANVGPFPLLEKLTFALPFFDGEDEVGGIQHLEILSEAPQLQQLFFTEYATPSMFLTQSMFIPSLGHLRYLACQSVTGDAFLSFMKAAPLLTEFIGSVDAESLIFHKETRDIVTQNSLQTLQLINNSSTRFLRFLRLPALFTLELQASSRTQIPDDDFLPFITHSSTSLQKFSTGTNGSANPSMACLALMSNLTRLDLNAPSESFFSAFFSGLDFDKSKEFLPQLYSLKFANCTRDANVTVQAISSRWKDENDPLYLFHLIWREQARGDRRHRMSLNPSTVNVFNGLVRAGMDIHIGREGANQIKQDDSDSEMEDT